MSAAVTHHFELQTRLTFSALSAQVLKAAELHNDMRLGVIADPTGEWTAHVLSAANKVDLYHIATSPTEQTEAQRCVAETSHHKKVTWEVLSLPMLPNPVSFRFEALLCGLNVTSLALSEFFAWARQAILPGGRFIITPELFCGINHWRKHYIKYRQWRARYLDRLIDSADQDFPTRDMLIAELQTAGFQQILVQGLQLPSRLSWSEYVLVTAR